MFSNKKAASKNVVTWNPAMSDQKKADKRVKWRNMPTAWQMVGCEGADHKWRHVIIKVRKTYNFEYKKYGNFLLQKLESTLVTAKICVISKLVICKVILDWKFCALF